MINSLQIFTRKYNKFGYPSEKWKLKDNIYVSGTICFGLNQELTFDLHNTPALRKIIRLLLAITKCSNEIFTFSGNKGAYKIQICDYYNIKVYKISQNIDKLVFQSPSHIHELATKSLINIQNQLFPCSNEVRKYYFNLIYSNTNEYKLDFKFNYGDRVKTIVSETLKNHREGLVYNRGYDRVTEELYYTIITQGKPHKRRYLHEELQLLNL